MANIETSVRSIQAAYEKLGALELARLSGVNYTTIRALAGNGFKPKTVSILEKLEAAVNQPPLIEKAS